MKVLGDHYANIAKGNIPITRCQGYQEKHRPLGTLKCTGFFLQKYMS